MESALRCDMCGTAQWEWEESKFAYTAEENFCQGCYIKSVYSEQETASLPGTNVRLVPTTKMMSAKRIRDAKRRSEKMRLAKQEQQAEEQAAREEA